MSHLAKCWGGPSGTFGDEGNAGHDNNNLFLGSNYVYKVFNFCEINPFTKGIYYIKAGNAVKKVVIE